MSFSPRRFDRAFVFALRDAAGWSKAQMADLAAGLRASGIETAFLPYDPLRDEQLPLLRPHSPERCFIVDSNNLVSSPGSFRKFSVMLDHPCQLLGRMEGIDAHRNVLGWVDQTHVEAMAALGLAMPSVFLPHAGPDPVPDPMPFRERDIDLLFAGGLGEPVDQRLWMERRPDVPPLLDVMFFVLGYFVD